MFDVIGLASMRLLQLLPIEPTTDNHIESAESTHCVSRILRYLIPSPFWVAFLLYSLQLVEDYLIVGNRLNRWLYIRLGQRYTQRLDGHFQ